MTKKTYCRYVLVELKTGKLLTKGEKFKDFSLGNIQYIRADSFRAFPRLWERIETRFRTLEVFGRDCVLVYWTGLKAGKPINIVSSAGVALGMRGESVLVKDKDEYYLDLIKRLGVA